MSRLSIELVPETAWWKNVRSHVTKAEWEKCKTYAKSKTAGGQCIVCGSSGHEQGRNYSVDAHEVWAYDEDTQVQTLVDIIPLCPMCHACKHLGRTRMHSSPEQWARVIEHFQRVNDWSDGRVEQYIALAFHIWEVRSQMTWDLDVSFLSTIGVNTRVETS